MPSTPTISALKKVIVNDRPITEPKKFIASNIAAPISAFTNSFQNILIESLSSLQKSHSIKNPYSNANTVPMFPLSPGSAPVKLRFA